MFQLNENELEYLRSHFVTANISIMARTNPYVFTEQGLFEFLNNPLYLNKFIIRANVIDTA